MILRRYLFNRVTIVGVGLIGGSIAKAIKKKGLAKKVIGLSNSKQTINKALEMGVIDEGYTHIAQAVKHSDFIVFATPVGLIDTLMEKVNPHLKRGCVMTDVGGTKMKIVERSESVLSSPANFIGAHPLAGSEKKGVENAFAELFEKANCIVTPTANSNKSAKEKVIKFWRMIGSKTIEMSPEEHDEILARVSHLPHLVAYALMESIPEAHLNFGAGGLRDTTRIASSPPDIWADICLSNPDNILSALDDLVHSLAVIRQGIVEKDDRILKGHFVLGREKRDLFAKKKNYDS